MRSTNEATCAYNLMKVWEKVVFVSNKSSNSYRNYKITLRGHVSFRTFYNLHTYQLNNLPNSRLTVTLRPHYLKIALQPYLVASSLYPHIHFLFKTSSLNHLIKLWHLSMLLINMQIDYKSSLFKTNTTLLNSFQKTMLTLKYL